MRIQMLIAAVFLMAGSELLAQTLDTGGAGRHTGPDTFFFQAATGPGEFHGGTFEVVTAEVFSGKTVKGVPFSAQATTETTQVLADGNRIHRQTTASIYRDSEGRMRREQAIDAMLPFGPAGESEVRIFISDPVSGTNFVRSPRTEDCTGTGALEMGKVRREAEMASAKVRERIQVERPGITTKQTVGPGAGSNAVFRNESLGTQLIEGVQAEGTRTVVTIPAGQIGNERPIETVSERWYSPDLQMVVLTKNSDPRMGETTYKLTNINRAEPPASLFEVPAGCQPRR